MYIGDAYIGSGISSLFVVLLLIILIVQFFIARAIANLAKRKGRSWAAFFWLSFLVSPIIMWIIAATISPIAGSATYVDPVSAPSSPGSVDIAKEIEKLGSLKEQGLITKAEFEAKKKELLDRI